MRNRNIDFMKLSKIWRIISISIITLGLVLAMVRGVNLGIDFAGGTRLVMEIGEGFDKDAVDAVVAQFDDSFISQRIEGTQIEVRSQFLSTEDMGEVIDALEAEFNLNLEDDLLTLDEIGPSVGRELTQSAIQAVLIASLLMLIYISIRFKRYFAYAAITALVHDVLFTMAIFSIFNISINLPFVAAILTIIGYSINDTIVIFDRIRENLKIYGGKKPKKVANISINITINRSINTLLTTLFTIVAVLIFVPPIRDFALPISLGVLVGGLSSIFVASPVWVMIEERRLKSKVKA